MEPQTPMMRSIGLFFFSGTGNTAVLMADLAAEFRRRGVDADLAEIEGFTLKKTTPELGRYDLVGLGYPVHAFNAPRIVFDFVNLLPPGNGQRVFLLKCPGDHFAHGGSTAPLRRALRCRGYEVVHEGLAVMPANFAVRYPPALVRELHAIAGCRLAVYVEEMLAGTRRLQRNTLGARLMTCLAPLERCGAKMLRFHFFVRPACTGCGLCATHCPVANITMQDGRPGFGWNCLCCLRCVYLCPVKAIGMRGFNRLLFKDGYNIRAILDAPATTAKFLRPGLKGYFRRFLDYAKGVGN
jgi:ferredoxin/flavodoxin